MAEETRFAFNINYIIDVLYIQNAYKNIEYW